MTLVERTEEQEAVGDDGYRRIRTDIVFGRLRPGQKLRLEGLKQDYGVSVSTLREILNRLTADGFVLAEGRRIVRRTTREAVEIVHHIDGLRGDVRRLQLL